MPTTFSDLPTEIRQRILFTAVSSVNGNSENLRLARIDSVSALEKIRKTKGWVWGVNADNIANNGTAFTADMPITTIPAKAPSELKHSINALISVDRRTTKDMLWVLEKLQSLIEEKLPLVIEQYCKMSIACYDWDYFACMELIEEKHGPVSDDEFFKQEQVLYSQASDGFAAQTDTRQDLADVLAAGKFAVALVGAEAGLNGATAFTERDLGIHEGKAKWAAMDPQGGTMSGNNYIAAAVERIEFAKHGLEFDEWTTVLPGKKKSRPWDWM